MESRFGTKAYVIVCKIGPNIVHIKDVFMDGSDADLEVEHLNDSRDDEAIKAGVYYTVVDRDLVGRVDAGWRQDARIKELEAQNDRLGKELSESIWSGPWNSSH